MHSERAMTRASVRICIEAIKKKVETEINSYIGLSAKIKLCESGSIQRSEGKAVRVIDRRE